MATIAVERGRAKKRVPGSLVASGASVDDVLTAGFSSRPILSPIPDPAAFIVVSEALSLVARIVHRVPGEVLARSLGAAAACQLRGHRLRTVAKGLAFLESAGLIGRVAAGAGLDVAFLKFTALVLTDVTPLGTREASDVDVLASPDQAPTLSRLLRAEGFVESPHSLCQHQLPALHHPMLGTVEIHTFLPGVRRSPREGFVRFRDLAAAGALVRIDTSGVQGFAPVPWVLAAHLLAHGMAQHGTRPDSYPLLRMVADLSDLGVFRDPPAHSLDSIQEWCRREVPAKEFETVLRLGRALEAGIPLRQLEGRARTLALHMVLGGLDPDYVRALRLSVFRKPLSESPQRDRAVGLLRTLIPRAESSALAHRESVGPRPWVRSRFLRPVVLLGRLAASGMAVASARRRRATFLGEETC